MSIQYICDGCGKTENVKRSAKPHVWFVREDEDGEQHACSRGCIPAISKATGKTGLVLPK